MGYERRLFEVEERMV
jgi:hypothetical protein